MTWKKSNPNWSIRILDKNNLHIYLDKEELPEKFEYFEELQKKSNFIRLLLLKKYGGCWLDVSIILRKSLDSLWKNEYVGFFKEEKNIIENWFMMCPKNHPLINIWFKTYKSIWGKNRNSSKGILKQSLFEGLQIYQKIEDAEYLNMHATLFALSEKDSNVKNLINKAYLFSGNEAFSWRNGLPRHEAIYKIFSNYSNFNKNYWIIKFIGWPDSLILNTLNAKYILNNKRIIGNFYELAGLHLEDLKPHKI